MDGLCSQQESGVMGVGVMGGRAGRKVSKVHVGS